jgi:hypothetical protein
LLVILVRHTPGGSPVAPAPAAEVEPVRPTMDSPNRPELAPPAVEERSDDEPDRDPNRTAHVPARVEVRQLLKRHGHELTPERVAKRTGVGLQHARKLLREERGTRGLPA